MEEEGCLTRQTSGEDDGSDDSECGESRLGGLISCANAIKSLIPL